MSRPFVVVGDKLSHGGTVVSGAAETDIGGKPVARIGDKAVCAAHGPTTIVSGDATVIIDGNRVARDGDRTGCGATLIASQATTGIN